MGFLRKLFYKFLYWTGFYLYFTVSIRKTLSVKVLNVKETFALIEKGRTLIRFGDGELRLLMGVGDVDFQKRDRRLEADLKKIYDSYCQNQEGRVLLCLPGFLSNYPREYELTKDGSYWVFTFLRKYFSCFKKLFLASRQIYFGEASITRPYCQIQNLEYAEYVFGEFKRILMAKRILLIEGRFTRFGVGNDLFYGARSVKRILGPETNAYDKIDEIYDRARKEDCDMVLIALGPAAKVLAYRLSEDGFFCLDVGHLDVEYEWYKLRAKEKVNIENKYVNECNEKLVVNNFVDKGYEEEIIYRCG